MKQIGAAALSLMVMLLVAACSAAGPGRERSDPRTAVQPLLDRLRAAGIEADIVEILPEQGLFDPERFAVDLVNIRVNGEIIRAYIFADEAQRAAAAAEISPTGDQITRNLENGDQVVIMLETAGASHVWVDGRYLLWYYGEAAGPIAALDGVLGRQIADGTRPHQPEAMGSGPIMGLGPAADPDFDGLALQWDPYLAYEITIERLPAQPFDPAAPQRPVLPERIVLTLYSDKIPVGNYPPEIVISGEPFSAVDLPGRELLHFAENYIPFEGGGGLRWLAVERGPAAVPVRNGQLYYLFKGDLTDQSLYVYARIPLANPILDEMTEIEVDEQMPELIRPRLEGMLNAARTPPYSPRLAAIDDLLQSLRLNLTSPLPGVAARGFQPLPDLGRLDSAKITPAAGPDHWAIRLALAPGGPMEIAYQGAGRADLDPALAVRIERLDPARSCGEEITPACLFDVVVVREGEVEVFNSPEQIAAFLGEIDSPDEAHLLLNAHDYFATPPPELAGGAWRPAAGGDGYDIYVLRRTSSCDPVETTRFLLHVGRDGRVAVRYQDLWSRGDFCI